MQYAACFDKAIESLGALDIIINSAGIMNDAEWDSMIDINYVSNIRLVKNLLFPHDIDHNSNLSLTKATSFFCDM